MAYPPVRLRRIEVPDELAWAQEHGADHLQGYLLGRPAEYPTLGFTAA